MAYPEQTNLMERLKDGLEGISQKLLEQHYGLYKGYVNNLNLLRKEMEDARAAGQTGGLVASDRRRRFGFEYNGVVLHELYFGNLKKGGTQPSDRMKEMLARNFGSYDAWKAEFENAGKTRSIGWAVLYYDPSTDTMNNHFIQLHEDGNVAGLQPVLVMDVWEHAYILDQGAAGRPAYITAFFNNIDWDVAEQRLNAAANGQIIKRFPRL